VVCRRAGISIYLPTLNSNSPRLDAVSVLSASLAQNGDACPHLCRSYGRPSNSLITQKLDISAGGRHRQQKVKPQSVSAIGGKSIWIAGLCALAIFFPPNLGCIHAEVRFSTKASTLIRINQINRIKITLPFDFRHLSPLLHPNKPRNVNFFKGYLASDFLVIMNSFWRRKKNMMSKPVTSSSTGIMCRVLVVFFGQPISGKGHRQTKTRYPSNVIGLGVG